jgi:hypothetical protein
MLHGGATMPEFTTVSVQEAQIRTIPGRQGLFINEYADYIQEVRSGQAGKIHAVGDENPLTIRRRLVSAAKALGIHIIIKRSGNDLYFWREDEREERPRTTRRYTRRGSPGNLLPQTTGFSTPEMGEQEEESTPMDQAFVEIE